MTVLDDNLEAKISNSQRKRKHSSTELDNCESRKKCKTADVFRFSNQGIWVADAYDDDFFIGTVFDVTNFEVATVQFLNRFSNCIYTVDGQELMMLLKSGINLFLPLMSRLF